MLFKGQMAGICLDQTYLIKSMGLLSGNRQHSSGKIDANDHPIISYPFGKMLKKRTRPGADIKDSVLFGRFGFFRQIFS
jgi:hypothetical protein